MDYRSMIDRHLWVINQSLITPLVTDFAAAIGDRLSHTFIDGAIAAIDQTPPHGFTINRLRVLFSMVDG
jgi:hypothetical protein